MTEPTFEQLIAQAEAQPFSGWDFSFLRGRMREGALSWDYADLVRRRLTGVDAVLDMGTGGGEILAGLAPLPSRTVATEAYPPNVDVARARLVPLGVDVVAVKEAPGNVRISTGDGVGTLPFPDASFPLVINRHTSYYPAEVYRLLQQGGRFVTEQMGGEHAQEINRLLDAPSSLGVSLEFVVKQLEDEGLEIVDRREEYPDTVFTDIGALVYYLKAVPWQVPNFTVDRYRDRLVALHERMLADGGLRIPGHYLYLEAIKPIAIGFTLAWESTT